jgi:TonB family protein
MTQFGALVCATLSLSLFIPQAMGAGRQLAKRISTIDKQLEQVRLSRDTIRSAPVVRDLRGRSKAEDIGQWAYSAEMERRVEALLKTARASDAATAKSTLDDAERAIASASSKALEIAGYWDRLVPMAWRARWMNFAAKYELPEMIPDERLIETEAALLGHLERGEFVQAAQADRQLETLVNSAFQVANLQRFERKFPKGLPFFSRRTPCPDSVQGRASGSARMTKSASPVDFYPPQSRKLNEQGSITLVAHVVPTGCATKFAIVETSGFPRLDEAAIGVAEASRYAAATESGEPVEGEVIFRVQFKID